MKRTRSTDPRPPRRTERIVVATAFGAILFAAPNVGHAASDCDGALTTRPRDLTAAFATAPDGLDGADYQRAIDLPDGRRLWTFQDAYVDRASGSDVLVHNVGLVQDGDCFELLHGGTSQHPAAWLAADRTDPFERWFWPLGATLPGDGTVRIFVAEFDEPGPRYLSNAQPVATWLATVDADTLTPIDLEPAPDPSAALYGWSVASDARHTYLYGHCYRQFGFGWLGHDSCAAQVTVARTSHDLTRPLEYWDGARWSRDPAAAAGVAPRRAPDGIARNVNPAQVTRIGDRWVAVTKEGDWWGDRIFVDVADQPTGPFRTATVIDASEPDPDLNNYFAGVVATDGGELVIALSHNRWDGRRSDVYRPTFLTVPVRALTASPPSPFR